MWMLLIKHLRKTIDSNDSEKTLKRFLREHRNEDFILHNGTKIQIKRKVFERYLDEKISAL